MKTFRTMFPPGSNSGIEGTQFGQTVAAPAVAISNAVSIAQGPGAAPG